MDLTVTPRTVPPQYLTPTAYRRASPTRLNPTSHRTEPHERQSGPLDAVGGTTGLSDDVAGTQVWPKVRSCEMRHFTMLDPLPFSPARFPFHILHLLAT